MLRPALRAVAPRWPRGLLARAMSSKLVATVTGPADKDALSTFTRTVMGQGAKLGGSRSIEVSGTVSIASVLYMPDKLAEKDAIESVTALQWALQANLAGYIVTVRPGRVGNPPQAFARVHVSGADRMGILAELASHCESRGLRVATMRTQTDSSRYGPDGIEGTDDDDEPLYTCVCTLATHEDEVDAEWVKHELYEFGDKADLTVDVELLAKGHGDGGRGKVNMAPGSGKLEL
jgi:glycine cleavage system regulatory protein